MPVLPKSLRRLAADPRVLEVLDERENGNGYTVYLKHGWRMPEMITGFRGYTVRETLDTARSIERGCTESPCPACSPVAPAQEEAQ